MNRPRDQLWEDLRAAQDRSLEKSDTVKQVRELMPLRAPARIRHKPGPSLLAVAVLAGLLLVVGIRFGHRGAKPLTFAIGEPAAETAGHVGAWIAVPAGKRSPLKFSDGSAIVLEPSSRARVTKLDVAGAQLMLENGGAQISVVHGPSSQWRFDVGPFEVNVVGTRFELKWDPRLEVLRLMLTEGAVKVEGAFLRKPLEVTQGQTLIASCADGRAELVQNGSAPTLPVVSVTEPQAEPGAPPPVAAPERFGNGRTSLPALPPSSSAVPENAEGATWQKLAAVGKYTKALETAERAGFEAECRHATGSDLLLLADAARLTGHPLRARAAYLAARQKLSGGGRTAYGLGLVAFDQQRDFAEAARWFASYLTEQPQGSLRLEAMGRLMEALRRSGDNDGARRVAQDYLNRYPAGPHATLARRLALH